MLAIQTLAKKLDDTTLQLGGETFAAARTIYSATKTPSANTALRKAADDLAKRKGVSIDFVEKWLAPNLNYV